MEDSMSTQGPREELIPLSHLALDLEEPLDGWGPVLAARGIELVEDDLGRAAIARADARRLIEQRRAFAERQAAQAARAPAEVGVPAGIPAQDGLSPFESLVAAPGWSSPKDEFGWGPGPSWREEFAESAKRKAELDAERRERREMGGR
jgi:hypothetical protein